MTDEKKTAPEIPENDASQNGAAADPENITIDSIKDIVTISGERAYTDNGELSEAAREYLHKHIAAIAAALAPDFYKTMEDVIDVTNTIKAYLNSDAVRNSMRSFIDTMQPVLDNLQPIQDLIDEIRELEPYLKAELDRSEYEGQTLECVMDDYTPGELLDLRNDPDSFFARAIEAAKAARDVDRETKIDVYKASKLDLPTDKLNLFAWDLRETNGQIKFNLSRAGSDDTATALFSLSFDDDPNIKLTREINHFDKRVMSACGTAFASGYPIISATGIYYAMGNTGKPNPKHINKINDTLTKLDMAKVFVDNTIEAGTYNYPIFRKEDRLLHFKRVSRIVNGKTTDAVIQILEEPILMTFARQRKQISAIPIKVLQTPSKRTNNYYQIEDYLLWRIAQQKNKVGKLREQQQKKYTQNRQRDLKEAAKLTILLATFYERTGNAKKDATGKKRARNTAEECLTHYMSEAGGFWITDYKMKSDRIEITLPIKQKVSEDR